MASIQEMLNNKVKTRKETTPPGVYTSKVLNIKYDDRYSDGAYVITYELQGQNKTYAHTEYFINSFRFERTRKFYKYLNEHRIAEIDDFVGCIEELDLRWNFTNTGKRELKVHTRKFIGVTPQAASSSQLETEEKV